MLEFRLRNTPTLLPYRTQLVETTPQRSRLMSRVRQRETSLELAVREIVYGLGYRYRLNARRLPGSPDLANQTHRWAIFVHGCYWHAHDACTLWTIPRRNRKFWQTKFHDNRSRDARKIFELEQMGISVLVIWQCEIQSGRAADKIQRFMTDIYDDLE